MTILGRFELVVISVLLGLSEEDAYSVKIREEIRKFTGHRPWVGQLHATLGHLVERGLLSTSMSAPFPFRGGKPRRLYTIEPAGISALEQNVAALRRTLDAIDMNALAKLTKGGRGNDLSPQTATAG